MDMAEFRQAAPADPCPPVPYNTFDGLRQRVGVVQVSLTGVTGARTAVEGRVEQLLSDIKKVREGERHTAIHGMVTHLPLPPTLFGLSFSSLPKSL